MFLSKNGSARDVYYFFVSIKMFCCEKALDLCLCLFILTIANTKVTTITRRTASNKMFRVVKVRPRISTTLSEIRASFGSSMEID